jgi:MFS family permease
VTARETFSSLTNRNYRLFFTGQLISVSGKWMQTVAQSFVVLQLTSSGTVLGLTTAVLFAPMFLFAPWGGLVADRLNKRRLLYVTQTAAGVLALIFGILIQTHTIKLWMVFVLAALLGMVNVFDIPTRQSMIPELVKREQVHNAILLNSVTINMSRVFGGALGGAAASLVGLSWSFYLNALSFVGVLITLVLMSADAIAPSVPVARARGQLRAGMRYVRGTPELLVPLLMTLVIGTFAWEFQISLPLLAKDVFSGDVATYGAMTAFMGLGAVAGGLISAVRPRTRARDLAITAVGWGVAITCAALAPGLPTEYFALLFVGYGSVVFNSLAKTTLQLIAAPDMRGRVMSLWMIGWQGTTPVGGPLIGWIAEEVGARWSLLAGGIPAMLTGVLAFPVLDSIDRRRRNTVVGQDSIDSADIAVPIDGR